jgi:predicted membrane-bound spermidine synthase
MSSPDPGFRRLYLLFFLSGFPALIYQIVWQRALFAIYGVNVESVTVVVSAFMLGLGLGSLAGGRLSRIPGVPLLAVFGAIELGIALFGIASLPLFHRVAEFTAGVPAIQTGLITFALVVLPTTLMGATLPLLVAHLVGLSGNVGRSVGILYFVNTLGSATACFAAAEFTMPKLGMSGSIWLAAAINTAIGSTVLAMHFFGARERVARPAMKTAGTQKFRFGPALLLSGAAGFISLGYEIVWYRVYSFVTGGGAKAFAFVLGAFLAGIALGGLFSRRLCRTEGEARGMAATVLTANLLGFVSVPLIAAAVAHVPYIWTLPVVAAAAGLLGAVFPLVCHASVPADERAGTGTSYLYLANIIGSASGSFLVGFVLLDVWPLRGIVAALAIAGIVVAATIRFSWTTAIAAATLCGAVALISIPLFDEIYERLQYKEEYVAGERFTDIIETRSGVITVDRDRQVFGGGSYDGYLIADITEGGSLLRPYSLSLYHPAPKDVLMVCMAGGAWVEVVANHPQVERVTVVEINRGYPVLMQRYPAVSPVLSNPKVNIVIDDGRRWLIRNPERRFDFILMDTPHHWRSNLTNLLSREFLELARKHLRPGGVLYYNTTHSAEAQATAVSLFPHIFRFGPFLAVSDSPLAIDRERWRSILVDYRLEGVPIFTPGDPHDQEELAEILSNWDTLKVPGFDPYGMETGEQVRKRVAGHRIITDDNMASEWTR